MITTIILLFILCILALSNNLAQQSGSSNNFKRPIAVDSITRHSSDSISGFSFTDLNTCSNGQTCNGCQFCGNGELCPNACIIGAPYCPFCPPVPTVVPTSSPSVSIIPTPVPSTRNPYVSPTMPPTVLPTAVPSPVGSNILNFNDWTIDYSPQNVIVKSPFDVSIVYGNGLYKNGARMTTSGYMEGTFCADVSLAFVSGTVFAIYLSSGEPTNRAVEKWDEIDIEFPYPTVENNQFWLNIYHDGIGLGGYGVNVPTQVNSRYCLTWKVGPGGAAKWYVDGQLLHSFDLDTWVKPLKPYLSFWGSGEGGGAGSFTGLNSMNDTFNAVSSANNCFLSSVQELVESEGVFLSLSPSLRPQDYDSTTASSAATSLPYSGPTSLPSLTSTHGPSTNPSTTASPSPFPIVNPSKTPTYHPSEFPTFSPSSTSSALPISPSKEPSITPSSSPSTIAPSRSTYKPSTSQFPIMYPTKQPTCEPSIEVKKIPTVGPSKKPAQIIPPSNFPTIYPSHGPSIEPSQLQTERPSQQPSTHSIIISTEWPTFSPSKKPVHSTKSKHPTKFPSQSPVLNPSFEPTLIPTILNPTVTPSSQPSTNLPNALTSHPSGELTSQPSTHPTHKPVVKPLKMPVPSAHPASLPSINPTHLAAKSPTFSPSPNSVLDGLRRLPTMLPTTIMEINSLNPSPYPNLITALHAPTLISTSPTQISVFPSTDAPIGDPSVPPTFSPLTGAPIGDPSVPPTLSLATNEPIGETSLSPTLAVTVGPLVSPTLTPSTDATIASPSVPPTLSATDVPIGDASLLPILSIIVNPSVPRTSSPSIDAPIARPSIPPMVSLSTNAPIIDPSEFPVAMPSRAPSKKHSSIPAKVTKSPQPKSFTADASLAPLSQPPSLSPSGSSSVVPSLAPTLTPSVCSSITPSLILSWEPSVSSSFNPSSIAPSFSTSNLFSASPSQIDVEPTAEPTLSPSMASYLQPFQGLSSFPLFSRTEEPSAYPTAYPSPMPIKISGTIHPTPVSSRHPITCPSLKPSENPTSLHTVATSIVPSHPPLPTSKPSQLSTPSTVLKQPIAVLTSLPSDGPSIGPSDFSSLSHSTTPSKVPFLSSTPKQLTTMHPTYSFSIKPSVVNSKTPTKAPFKITARITSAPTVEPSTEPSLDSSFVPSVNPSLQPALKSIKLTESPSKRPISSVQAPLLSSFAPSMQPTDLPIPRSPSILPTEEPSYESSSANLVTPSIEPISSKEPSTIPALNPFTRSPSYTPTHIENPTNYSTLNPSYTPNELSSMEPTVLQPIVSLFAFPSSEPSVEATLPSVEPSSPLFELLSSRPLTELPSILPNTIPIITSTTQRPSSALSPSQAPAVLLNPVNLPHSVNPFFRSTLAPSYSASLGTVEPTTAIPPPAQNQASPTHTPTVSLLLTSSSTVEPSMEPTIFSAFNPTLTPFFSANMPTLLPSTFISVTAQPWTPTSNPSAVTFSFSSLPSTYPSVQPANSINEKKTSSFNPIIFPTLIPSIITSTRTTVVQSIKPSSKPFSTSTTAPSNETSSKLPSPPSINPILTRTNRNHTDAVSLSPYSSSPPQISPLFANESTSLPVGLQVASSSSPTKTPSQAVSTRNSEEPTSQPQIIGSADNSSNISFFSQAAGKGVLGGVAAAIVLFFCILLGFIYYRKKVDSKEMENWLDKSSDYSDLSVSVSRKGSRSGSGARSRSWSGSRSHQSGSQHSAPSHSDSQTASHVDSHVSQSASIEDGDSLDLEVFMAQGQASQGRPGKDYGERRYSLGYVFDRRDGKYRKTMSLSE